MVETPQNWGTYDFLFEIYWYKLKDYDRALGILKTKWSRMLNVFEIEDVDIKTSKTMMFFFFILFKNYRLRTKF